MSTEFSDLEEAAGPSDRAFVHSGIVRVTHWLLALSFLGLIISAVAILLVHPRLYWGETGTWGVPALIELPLPYIRGHSGWGRYLHFLAAWVCVLSGLTYVVSGSVNQHIRTKLLPRTSELSWRRISSVIWDHLRWRRPQGDESWSYNIVQRLTYLIVIFVLFPGMVWTGLAMSPAITSVFPSMVTVLGGHQSARTLHFVISNFLLLFFVVHLAMLFLVGFTSHVRAMITGYRPSSMESQ